MAKRTKEEKELMHKVYGIGARMADEIKERKAEEVSEIIAKAREDSDLGRSINELVLKWGEEAEQAKRQEIYEQIKQTMPKKPRPFGN